MTDYIVPEDQQEDWEGFSGSQTDIEDQSLHPATLVDLKRKILPSKFDPSGQSPAVIWTFALNDAEGRLVDGTTNDQFYPGTKPHRWAGALIGKGMPVDVPKAALIGREGLVLVEMKANGYLKVTNVLPAQKPAGATQKPEVAPDTAPAPVAAPEASDGVCEAFSAEFGRCERDSGHGGLHRNKDKETWHATS